MLVLTGCYVGVDLIIRVIAGSLTRETTAKTLLTAVFDGVTFATSMLLLASFVYPEMWDVIGDTKTYLMIAGLAGLAYSINALVPPSLRRLIFKAQKKPLEQEGAG